MLANDIAWVMRELLEYDFYVTLDDVRRDAIGDMYFNLGAARFLGFKNLILALNAKSWDLAADAVLNSLWASEVKSRASDIASMLRSGEYPS
jgi:lysozyme